MKERPILFSAPMVRAILEGRKTQTRRIVKNPSREYDCPYGQPGDRLWVKETHGVYSDLRGYGAVYYKADGEVRQQLCADYGEGDPVGLGCIVPRELRYQKPYRWTPSILMPRWASRITLEIVSVRVERLNEISEADAKAEGADIMKQCEDGCWLVCGPRIGSYRQGYRWLWESLNGPGSWAANPWVWVVEFRRVEK